MNLAMALFAVIAAASLESQGSPGAPRVSGEAFGAAIASGPDLDGDEAPEFFVSSPGPSGLFGPYEPRNELGAVWCFSGASGKLLWVLVSPSMDDGFGWALAASQSHPRGGPFQLLVGCRVYRAGHAGRVYAVGATGQVEQVYRAPRGSQMFGSAISVPLDVTGDGKRDFLSLSGDWGADLSDVVLVSGDNGAEIGRYGRVTSSTMAHGVFGWCPSENTSPIPRVYVATPSSGGGMRLAIIEPATGAQVLSMGVGDSCGFASVWNHQNGTCEALLARTKAGLRPIIPSTSILGIDVALIDCTDVAFLSAADAQRPIKVVVGDGSWGIGEGRVTVHDPLGASEPVVLTTGKVTWHIGSRVARLGDVNGDGIDDVLVAEDTVFAHEDGKVWVFCGRRSAPLYYVTLAQGLDVKTVMLAQEVSLGDGH